MEAAKIKCFSKIVGYFQKLKNIEENICCCDSLSSDLPVRTFQKTYDAKYLKKMFSIYAF